SSTATPASTASAIPRPNSHARFFVTARSMQAVDHPTRRSPPARGIVSRLRVASRACGAGGARGQATHAGRLWGACASRKEERRSGVEDDSFVARRQQGRHRRPSVLPRSYPDAFSAAFPIGLHSLERTRGGGLPLSLREPELAQARITCSLAAKPLARPTAPRHQPNGALSTASAARSRVAALTLP